MAKEYNVVFAALDGSAAQVEVAKRALQVAQANKSKLIFGHVISDSAPVGEFSALDPNLVEKIAVERIEEHLADVFKKAREDERVQGLELIVKQGPIQKTLQDDMITPNNPDIVICGERGFNSLHYALVGSVSTHLIRHLVCDVLVVKQA